ncbi:hypothetical protein GCM10007049_35890 [Echinicola pacifica]|uniref:Uncharacterized protein n=1 Tax=Echinicola pacifica TaxID=346377 RepID=A0A918QAS3_9BACT|nr:hypothetical protein [Echinicola pacifica]GGZ39334.1 hypothetical protein GCM10007049_35890 [Echinicola pacifica]
MEKIIEKISKQLKPLLQRLILAVSVDGQILDGEDENTLFGEEVKIYFSDDKTVEITTDDIPHFYGEGDLDLKFEKNRYSEKLFSKFNNKSISGIKIYGWKRKGINLFKAAKYLVQIEFYHNDELLLSSGFFYFDQSTKKMEGLITGELSVSPKYNLSIDDYEGNLLLLDEIK